MKKKAKKICVVLASALVGASIVGCGSTGKPTEKYPITLTNPYNGKEVMTVETTISDYIKNAHNYDYLAGVLHERQTTWKSGQAVDRYDHQKVDISWEGTGVREEYTVYVADNADFTNAFTYTTRKNSVSQEIGIFVPNKKYYYKVVGSESGSSKVDSFIPVAPVRYISTDSVLNMRDLGGWETKDGKKINYGKIYRGAALNEPVSYLSENAKNVFDYLGIKGEIDLRGENTGDKEYGEKNENKIDPDYPMLREGITYFAYRSMTENNMSAAKENLPKIFEFLANEDNYPVYFHCSVGADRTGTIAYILETLLGVDFDTVMVDYELTSFTNMTTTNGTRQRSSTQEKNGKVQFLTPSATDPSYTCMEYAHTLLQKTYRTYSDDMQKVMEKYLCDVGVNKAHIDKFKEIML